jgi:hypothetical protein
MASIDLLATFPKKSSTNIIYGFEDPLTKFQGDETDLSTAQTMGLL